MDDYAYEVFYLTTLDEELIRRELEETMVASVVTLPTEEPRQWPATESP